MLSSLAFALTARADGQAVVRAFLRIQARTETGVSYRDFGALVGDANLEVKVYEASPEGRAHKEAIDLFRAALLQYVVSSELWSLRFSGGRFSTDTVGAETAFGRLFAEQFPDGSKLAKDGGAKLDYSGVYAIQFMLPFYWREAKELANKAISKM